MGEAVNRAPQILQSMKEIVEQTEAAKAGAADPAGVRDRILEIAASSAVVRSSVGPAGC